MEKMAHHQSETERILLVIAREKQVLSRAEEGLPGSIIEGGKRSQTLFRAPALEMDHEELHALLEALRGEEEDHRTRLRSLLEAMEADRSSVDGVGTIGSMLSAGRGD